MTTSAFGAGDIQGAQAAPAAPVSAAVDETSRHEYAGLITRSIAFVIDAAIVNVIAILVAAAVALGMSVLPGQQRLRGLAIIIAGAVYVIWCIAYWATFWATTGQTPGDRVMHLRVVDMDGRRVHWLRSVVRVGATVLAALPLLAGFVPILFTPKRRGVHDWIAGTVVVYEEPDVAASANVRAAGVRERLARSTPR
jgi:uncharacterized RDD family membrane protein YckC